MLLPDRILRFSMFAMYVFAVAEGHTILIIVHTVVCLLPFSFTMGFAVLKSGFEQSEYKLWCPFADPELQDLGVEDAYHIQ